MTEPHVVIHANDITDAGTLGRQVLRTGSTEELRKLLVLPRKKSVTLERVGWWLVGSIISLVVASVIAVGYWSSTRTVKETLEGGWTRNVIDYNVSYVATFVPIAAVCLAVWTIGYVAWALIEDNS